MILRDESMVLLYKLLATRQWHRAVSVHLACGGSLANFVVDRSERIRHFFDAHGRVLLGVGVAGNRCRLFFGACLALANESFNCVRAIAHRVMLAFPCPPIRRQGEGAS